VPGKIYLCVPDKEKSFLAGTFLLQVKGRRVHDRLFAAA
jgi:hypothetical protein